MNPLHVLRLHPDRGGEFSSDLLQDFCRGEGILQSFTLPASPQKNGIAEHRIGLVMEVARTSMIHAAAPHFLWPFADVTFDESVPFYYLFPYLTAPLPPRPLFLAPDPVEVAVDSCAAWGGATRGAASGGAEPAGAKPGGTAPACTEPGVAEYEGAEPGGAEPERAEPGGADPERNEPGGTLSIRGPRGTLLRREPLSPPQLCEWFTWRTRLRSGAAKAGGPATGGTGAGAAGGTRAAGHGGARTGGTGAAGAGGAAGVDTGGTGAAGAGGAAGVGAGGTIAGAARGTRAAGPGGARTRGTGAAGSGGAGCVGVGNPGAGCYVMLSFAFTNEMPESNLLRAASPTLTCLLATVVTDPSFESTAASALIAELVDFATACRLDYAASLVAESESDCPPSVKGECALGTDVLEDRQEDFGCFAAAVTHLVSMHIAPEGDPDALAIPTPCSYAEAITGP
ncbi:unnamed protein product [Closterium sp. NIES-54]